MDVVPTHARAIAFHIVLDGDSETLVARPGKRQDTPVDVGVSTRDAAWMPTRDAVRAPYGAA